MHGRHLPSVVSTRRVTHFRSVENTTLATKVNPPMLHLKFKGAAVQNNPHTTLVTQTAPIANDTHGGRAKCLQRLVRLDLPLPRTVALSFNAVQAIAAGDLPDIKAVVDQFPQGVLL